MFKKGYKMSDEHRKKLSEALKGKPGWRKDAWKKDKRQDLVLKANGFKVYRFWEHEINESVEKCINRLVLVKYKK